MEKPQYIDWIVEETGIVIKDDIPLKCYKIDYKDDESILDDWALHIRRNYIEDTELKEDADDNAMTVEQYLHDYVIPQKGEELGATVRSADITEILISDLLEFVHQYSVPRYKLKNRSGKNNSQQGTDVIAYKYKNEDKLVVEHALKNKYVSCVVCTSTLAQGVNIPIKYLLVTSIRNGLKLVKARDFQNLMGRTARAGIYTEGSIIITDCKIYDNRTNWKNGGRYLWNDCVKLFDTKLTEPCGSSILSLVQDFNIDYDVTVSGEKFIDIVIDHLDERDFLLDYAKKLEKAYLKVNPKRTQNLIVQEILLRQDIISNIENYLCLVRSAETLVNDSKKSAVDICTNTLAYAMATEKEKELLIKVFQKIEENIQQYSVEKLSRYSNAMSGIGLSSLIEEWIVQNELTEKIYTETELLYVITELYLQICGDFRYQEHIQSICKKWIDGQTPMEINNKETIGIAEVESLCNKRISYEMNFLIGNICDLIEVDGENEEQVDQRNILTLLQKKVKYGVPNMTAISICESVFNDRLLAIELAQILSDANIGTDKILNMLKAHSEEIFSCLDSYPEYFKDRLSVLMK